MRYATLPKLDAFSVGLIHPLEQRTLQPSTTPNGTRLSPMSPVRSVTYVSGSDIGLHCPVVAALNMRHTDMPSMHVGVIPKPMMRRVKMSMTSSTQWLRRTIDSTRNRSTLQTLSFA
jgi:hypothetical protein